MNSLDGKLDMILSQGSRAPSVPSARGERDVYLQKAVRNTIRKRAGEIKKLYAQYLESEPDVTDGKVEMDWRIRPDGKVKSAEIIFSEFKDEEFTSGVLKAVSGWNFPPPPFGSSKYVVHTFNLKSKADEEPKPE